MLLLPVVVHHINEGGGPLCVLKVDVVNISVIHDYMILKEWSECIACTETFLTLTFFALMHPL